MSLLSRLRKYLAAKNRAFERTTVFREIVARAETAEQAITTITSYMDESPNWREFDARARVEMAKAYVKCMAGE